MNKYRNIRFLGVVFVLMIVVVGITAAKTSSLDDSNSLSVPPGDADAKICQAPLNSKFVEYQLMKNRGLEIASQKAPNGRGFGLVPSPVDLSHVRASSSGPGSVLSDDVVPSVYADFSGELPSSYDLRDSGGVTPVKDQGNAGTCWAFATYGSLESYLMPDDECDFSENNMKNLLSNTAPEGFDFGEGGNQYMSTAYLARWSGPVDENDDLYVASSFYEEEYPDYPEMKHVQEVEFIPGAQGPSADEYIKQAIMEKGAVYSTMYMASGYFNSLTNAYYYEGSSSSNHAITIVGWDDDFPASNFPNNPPGSGAFIVKNSWGTGWGEGGYFYVSYYDSLIGTSNAVFTAEGTDNYDCVYQYDPLGWVTSIGYGTTTAWAANVFTATGNEQIKAVSFYTTDSGTDYNLGIYTGVEGGPTSGTLQSYQSGQISTAGYHTVVLSEPVSILNGQKFSVVIKFSNLAYNYPIALEKSVSGYSSNAVANPGESYISSNGGSWTDVTSIRKNEETNVCLKAFTVKEQSTVLPVAAFTSNVTEGYVPLTVEFTDQSENANSWAWDGDNDGSVDSSSQNYIHVYQSPGIYTVNLTASNENGSDSEVKFDYITVLDPAAPVYPVADFSSNVKEGDAPLTVEFTDQSINADELHWDLDGDGVTDSTEESPIWTYESAGTYTVTLDAINSNGTDQKTGNIAVYEPAPPLVADFSASTESGKVPLKVTFTDKSTGNPVSWEWDFNGDGIIDSTVQNPRCVYPQVGTYTVSLTVKDVSSSSTETKEGFIIAISKKQ